jgi:hypothetical protein
MIKIYTIVTKLLLIPAALIGFFSFFLLLSALANLQILIPTFVMICIVIYSFASNYFLNKAIVKEINCKQGLKDLIKVNAFVVLLYLVLNISQSIQILLNPQKIEQAVKEIASANTQIFAKIQLQKVVYYFKLATIISAIYGIVLLVHVVFTFKFLKAFNHKFIKV